MGKNRQFGDFLAKHKDKSSTSLQKLADIYGCKRSYIWDIVKGNVSPPQNYKILIKFAEELKLSKQQTYELFDKATLENDIPPDIKNILLSNKTLIKEIREKKEKGEI
jgi:transcriptional regulator with XRE-family HTH domain